MNNLISIKMNNLIILIAIFIFLWWCSSNLTNNKEKIVNNFSWNVVWINQNNKQLWNITWDKLDKNIQEKILSDNHQEKEEENIGSNKKDNSLQEKKFQSKNEDIQKTLSKQEQVVKELKEKIEEWEKAEKDALEKLDFNYCNKYKTEESKNDCKLKILFSKNNTQGCNLVKWKDNNLYKKCLEIKTWIEQYKQIRKWKYYYEEYWQNNY